MYYIIRPLLSRVFPSLAAISENGSNKDDEKRSSSKSYSANKVVTAAADTATATNCTEFLRFHLENVKSKGKREYPSEFLQEVNSKVAVLSPEQQKEVDLLETRLKLSTALRTPHASASHEQRMAYAERRTATPSSMNVVTIAVTLENASSLDFQNLIRTLTQIKSVFVFLLVYVECQSPQAEEKVEREEFQLQEGSTKGRTSITPIITAQEAYDRVVEAMDPLCGSLDNPVFPMKRVLVSTTTTGRTAAVRQLKSTIHVDYDHEVCRNMEKHVRTIIHLKMDTTTSTSKEPAKCALGGEVAFSKDGIIQINRYSQLCSIEL